MAVPGRHDECSDYPHVGEHSARRILGLNDTAQPLARAGDGRAASQRRSQQTMCPTVLKRDGATDHVPGVTAACRHRAIRRPLAPSPRHPVTSGALSFAATLRSVLRAGGVCVANLREGPQRWRWPARAPCSSASARLCAGSGTRLAEEPGTVGISQGEALQAS